MQKCKEFSENKIPELASNEVDKAVSGSKYSGKMYFYTFWPNLDSSFCRGSWNMTSFWKRGITFQELVTHTKNCLFVFCWNIATYLTSIVTDRENVTLVTACSASSNSLPAMIVSRGQHVQSTCHSNIESKHKIYPWQFSNCKGWMISGTFFKWFKKCEYKIRTLSEAGEAGTCLLTILTGKNLIQYKNLLKKVLTVLIFSRCLHNRLKFI